ncbi:hypothetical protein D3C71_1415110 [compost metagenome]
MNVALFMNGFLSISLSVVRHSICALPSNATPNVDGDQRQVNPPSTGSETPVIIEAASLSKKTMGAAISASLAQRPSGICFRKGSATCGWLQWPDEIGVMTTVGLTLLTRIL